MIRKAILIEASNVQSIKDLPGARADVKNLSRYLMSNEGGAWESGEIQVLNNPTKEEVKRAVAAAKTAGYSFVAFSGHGHHVRYANVMELTEVCVSDGDITELELNPGNERCTISIDACRNLTVVSEAYKSAVAAFSYRKDTRAGQYRALFDAEVLKAEKGLIKAYSCNVHESAGENSNGGFFTGGLIISAERWSGQRHASKAAHTISDAFDGAVNFVKQVNPQQNPQYQGGRRINHFPFGVYIP